MVSVPKAEGMCVAVNLIDYDAQCPQVVAKGETLLPHHVGTEIGRTSPQLALPPRLIELLVPSIEDAVEVSDLGEALNRRQLTWLMRMFYSFKSPCLNARPCIYWMPLETPSTKYCLSSSLFIRFLYLERFPSMHSSMTR